MNLSEKIQSELQEMKNKFGARLCDSIDITTYFVQKRNLNRRSERIEKEEGKRNEIIGWSSEEKKEEEIVEEDENEESEDRDLY